MSTTQPSIRNGVAIAALLLVLPVVGGAQPADSGSSRQWELRITSGTLVPTGAQRRQLERGPLSTVQVSWLPRRSLAVTGTLGWAKSRDLTADGSPGLNAYAADLGVETRPQHWVAGERVSVSPFVGFGAGARSYDYRSRRSDARHNLAAYAALGGELGVGRIGLRVEAREYIGGFSPMDGNGPTAARSDLLMLVSLRFNRRPDARQ